MDRGEKLAEAVRHCVKVDWRTSFDRLRHALEEFDKAPHEPTVREVHEALSKYHRRTNCNGYLVMGSSETFWLVPECSSDGDVLPGDVNIATIVDEIERAAERLAEPSPMEALGRLAHNCAIPDPECTRLVDIVKAAIKQ